MHPATDVIFRVLEGGAVLIHLADNRIFELNETGAHIWAELTDGASTTAIVASLTGRFEVDAATAETEVAALCAQLQREGLLLP